MVKVQNPLTQTEKEWVLKETSGLPRFFSAETKAGMTDEALEKALKSVLGIFWRQRWARTTLGLSSGRGA